MERLILAGTVLAVVVPFGVYCMRCVAGRVPAIAGVKHNELLNLFFARFFVWLLGPLERALVHRVSPSQITAISVAACGATGIAVAVGNLGLGFALYIFAGALDIIDGRIARRLATDTPAGALLDSVADRWGELFVFAGYAWLLNGSPWMLVVLAGLGASQLVSYTRARAEALGVTLRGGLMQRAERIALVTVGTGGAALFERQAVPILGATMLACALLSGATAVNRLSLAHRALRGRERAPT